MRYTISKLIFHRKSGKFRRKKKEALELTDHEEGGGEIDADEVDADVAAEPERRDGGHAGGHVAEKPEPRLAAHPVGHHAGQHREQGHYHECAREVRHDRLGVGLELELQGARGEPRHAYVLEHAAVFRLADRVQEGLLPLQAAVGGRQQH